MKQNLKPRFTAEDIEEIQRRLIGDDATPRENLNEIARSMGMTSGQIRFRLLKSGWDIDTRFVLVRTGSNAGGNSEQVHRKLQAA